MEYTQLMKLFRTARRKAVDIALTDYRANQAVVDRAAHAAGYRFAGERLGRVVFTTKPGNELKR